MSAADMESFMLAGFRVLDCTDRLGWLAGRILADLGAEVLKADLPSTDRASVEWQALNVNKQVVEIGSLADLDARLASCDAILVAGGWPEKNWFDYPRLSRMHPRLVVVCITPWGLSGPRANWRGSDIEVMAGAGAMSLAGEPGGMPLRVSAPQSSAWASTHAAAGCLVALFHREKTGRGQLVDVSAQASTLIALGHAPAFWDMLKIEPTRAGAFMTGRSVKGARYRVFWPCRDGWINFILYGGVAGRRTNEQLVSWMKEAGIDPGPLSKVDWPRFDSTQTTQEEVDSFEQPIAEFFKGITKREFLEGAHHREMLGYPVSDMADIAADPQLTARDFWQDVTATDGVLHRYCGAFAVFNGVRPSIRHAPGTPFIDRTIS